MATKLDHINSRGTLFKKVRATLTKVRDQPQTFTLASVQVSLGNLDKWVKDYDDLHSKILRLCADAAERDVEDDAALLFEDSVGEARAHLIQLKQDLSTTSYNTGRNGNSSTDVKQDVRLPRLDLPTFSGSILDWTSFYNSFTACLDSNTSYTKSQKFQYLLRAVQGQAAELIKSLEITDGNYDLAWQILKERYDNKRHIILANMDVLFDQKSVNSTAGLRLPLDTTRKQVRVLNGLQADNWDAVLVHLMTKRLDSDTRSRWLEKNPSTDYPRYADLDKFLQERCQSLVEGCGSMQPQSLKRQEQPHQHMNPKYAKGRGSASHHSSTSSSSESKCPACKSAHPIYKCPEFLKMDVNDRKDVIKKNNLCYNCLAGGHSAVQCPSSSTCKKCNSRHHTMIHWVNPHTTSSSSQSATPKVGGHMVGCVARSLLSTALIIARDSSGNSFTCRAMLDNGSELSFITESLVQLLGVKRNKSNLFVTGIGGEVSAKSKGSVKLELESNVSGFRFKPELHILPKLSGDIPQELIKHDWSHLSNVPLADPTFYKPSKIDILLGADIYFQLLKDRTVRYTGKPSIYETHLGWIVSGSLKEKEKRPHVTYSHVSAIDIQSQLAKFWELEELKEEPQLTAEEVECDNHFAQTHSRDNTGRYVVALPFKKSELEIGGSKEQAIRRLHQVERRLSKSQQHREEYEKFMAEYLNLGHMEPVTRAEKKELIGRSFYLPHHFVLKETSTSTKFRVVFDGSAKSTTGVALNDKLMTGPRLQRDIFDILLRFQFYRFVFTADISKFFRQVLVRQEDQDFQRILWRNSTQSQIQEYRLTTVTYGTASAPYLSSKALMQLADDHGHEYPLARDIICNDFYVDDVMTGSHSEKKVLEMKAQLIQLLARGQFPLVKWVSNCQAVLETVPPDQRETQLPLLMESEDSVKALGLYWNPASDQFFFKVNLDREVKVVTKRTLLSDTAKLYDPLGMLAPVIIRAKMLFQSLWKQNLGWDEPLPTNLKNEWVHVRSGLFDLQDLRIDRHVICNESRIQLRVASELAYAAAVYVRSENDNGNVFTRIICSKTKVAPVKIVSIPKLELCSAVLLSRLLHRVEKTINQQIDSVSTWSDSTVVLDWLDDLPCRWKTFVANRVAEVQGLYSREKWNHVPTRDNPADCATRGLSAAEILDFDLWWFGPSWLRKEKDQWPKPYRKTENASQQEMRTATFAVEVQFDLTSKFSSLSKLIRVTAFILRFLFNTRNEIKRRGPLTPSELDQAFMHWVKVAQQQTFEEVLVALQKSTSVPKNLQSLNPFVDEDGFIRVGGRLQNSKLSFGQKHPLLLPANHELTTLIVRREHERLLHGGGQLISASLSKDFWILNAIKVIRKCLRSCITCFRFNAESMQQIMGNLSSSRLEPTRPFFRTGVDYGGPFTLKSMKGRGGKLFKAYISLFVCFSTKAIHIELVTELTTEGFLAALRRFTARRGKPLEIHSDNGTNFVGAGNELLKLYEEFNSQQHNHTVADQLATEGITWKFIPPKAPHFGGLWEAGIKSAKQHMKKVIGDTVMTYEEMSTSLNQIEACLNSRPISPQSSDPNDLRALTPGHFLIGEPLMSIPEPGLCHLPQNRLSRFQLVQQQLQHFWNRWHQEYLNTLQQRTKWKEPGVEPEVGDLVLVREDNLPPLKWIMARVVEKHPGPDKLTRVVTIKTSNGNLKRDIRKLCKLPS